VPEHRAAPRALLLTGDPGTGKTCLIRDALARTPIKSAGFYTEEIRIGGVRQGFKIVTLDGAEAILAHTGISSPHRIGKYQVDTTNLNKVAVPALRSAMQEADLVVIDEIGKMELLSPQFRQAVVTVLNSSKRLLGTVMLSPHPFADAVKRHPEVKTLLVTRYNRNEVMDTILKWLASE
jgi:nucleoside-triphosphatase